MRDGDCIILWRRLIAVLLISIALSGCALTPQETIDIARSVPTHNSDGTPRAPQDINKEIEEKGKAAKVQKGWGVALTLLQAALMIGGALSKKAVI